MYWQSNCQISVKSAKANNSYSDICEVISKHFSFRSCVFVDNVIHNDLKLKCFGVISQRPLLFALANLTEIWHFNCQ